LVSFIYYCIEMFFRVFSNLIFRSKINEELAHTWLAPRFLYSVCTYFLFPPDCLLKTVTYLNSNNNPEATMVKLGVNVLLVSALLTFNVFASDLDGSKISNLESTILNNETVLKHESYDAGAISGSFDVKFTAMVLTDPVKSKIVATGLKVTIIGDKNVTSTVYLDSGEVQNLSNAITLVKSISEKYATEKIDPYTEILYSSKGGFKFGYLNKGVNAGVFDSNSSLFIRTPSMESIFKDDEKRFGQMQTIIANVLFNVSRK
jgi:hypothetical protein